MNLIWFGLTCRLLSCFLNTRFDVTLMEPVDTFLVRASSDLSALRIFMEGDHPISPSGSGNNWPDCDQFRCHLAVKGSSGNKRDAQPGISVDP